MGAVFTQDERKILMKSLIGRSVLPPEPGKDQPAEVFIVKSLLAGFQAKHDKQLTASKWPWNMFAIAARYVASHSRSTHWAAQIRENYYETFRQEQYGWPKWAATLRTTDMETALRERIIVERVYVGKTTLSDREIASRVWLYEQQLRPYSVAGDNCQQFILQFCKEIGTNVDNDKMNQRKTASGLTQATRFCLLMLALFFVVDLFILQTRSILLTTLVPAFGMVLMCLITLAHPHMSLFSFSDFPYPFAHVLHSVQASFVFLIWIIFGIWTAFSVENVCDDVAISVENGETFFNFWNSCNISLRIFQLVIALICLAGYLYHSFYALYFAEGK